MIVGGISQSFYCQRIASLKVASCNWCFAIVSQAFVLRDINCSDCGNNNKKGTPDLEKCVSS